MQHYRKGKVNSMNFDEIMDKLEEGGKKALKKGKGVKDILKAKAEISSCEDVINRAYMAIGKKYYENFKDGGYGADYEKNMKDIANAEKAIKDIEDEIAGIKATM